MTANVKLDVITLFCFCFVGNAFIANTREERVHEFVVEERPTHQALSLSGRDRRDVSINETTIDASNETFNANWTTLVHLNDSNDQMLVHWAGNGSSALIVLSKSRFNASKASNVYFSLDYGNSYNKSDKLKLSNGDHSYVDHFYVSNANNSHYVFTDVRNKHLFTTRNYGVSFESIELAFTPDIMSLHKKNTDLLLAMQQNDTKGNLWFSEDFGSHWKIVQSDVKSFSWGADTDEENTVFIQRCIAGNCVLKSFSHKFKKNERDWINNIHDFQTLEKYIFVVRTGAQLGSHPYIEQLELWVSFERKSFRKANFPVSYFRKIIDYHIVDASDGRVMVAVTYNDSITDLFTSDIECSKFALSLRNIANANSTRNDTKQAPKKEDQALDIHKVQGLDAIFIANVWKEPDPSNKTYRNMESVITFNGGSKWSPLSPVGNQCVTKSNCNLHLKIKVDEFQQHSKRSQTISKASAVGIISGHGYVGSSLDSKTDMYLSKDAGLTWKKVLRGNYAFSYGDFGGIIVAVKNPSKHIPTNEIEYSLDEGDNWTRLKFLKDGEKIRIYGIMTEPGEKTSTFTLFGSLGNSSVHTWVLAKINFTLLFERKCNAKDYEDWSPQDLKKDCFMGRKETIQRRKSNARCLNDKNFVRITVKENCTCSYNDFECDYGFINSEEDPKTCRRDDTFRLFDPSAIPSDCEPGKVYLRSRGYRKIVGDTCEGGISSELSPDLEHCPEPNPQSTKESGFLVFIKKLQSSHIPLMLVIVTLIIVLGFMVARHRRLRRSFLSFVNSHYDTRSDSATILVTDGLDEEDTPVIRGFADDEPLVVA